MKKMRPRVSIGLPVFNGDAYLEETLDSILGQTFKDFELIITDNASTDRTQQICEEYTAADPRIRYYRNETNLGAAYNYNYTFRLAEGEYFKWAAHDDPYEPECVQRCVELLDREPDAIMSYSRTILIDEADEVIEYHNDEFDLHSPNPYERFRQFFHSSAWCHPVFGLIRREILGKTGLIGSYASSDRVLLGELALLGQCHEVPEHLTYRRLHPQNSTQANRTDEEMATWFDPNARKALLTPRWRRFWEYVKAIERAKFRFSVRVRCYLELGRFYLNLGRLRGVTKDLRQILKAFPRLLSRETTGRSD